MHRGDTMQFPDPLKCGKRGNMLAYNTRLQSWSIVTYNDYMTYMYLYSRWSYLPEEPESTLRTTVSAEDVDFLNRAAISLLNGELAAKMAINRHFELFTKFAKADLIQQYSLLDGSYDIKYVLNNLP